MLLSFLGFLCPFTGTGNKKRVALYNNKNQGGRLTFADEYLRYSTFERRLWQHRFLN